MYGLGSSFGFQTGFAMNFARDFTPRLATMTVGYGIKMMSAYNWYFWVPMILPLLACFLGGFIYDLLVYQGLDSPLNQPKFGYEQKKKKLQEFQLSDVKLNFRRKGDHGRV